MPQEILHRPSGTLLHFDTLRQPFGRHRDDSVHFKVLDYAGSEYAETMLEEVKELNLERVRLWYVALTRARDLLLLPRQSERAKRDWMSLIDVVVDWKSDTRLRTRHLRIYREQVELYLEATGARTGHIVYLGLDYIEPVVREN